MTHDLIITWPSYLDYPLFRQFLQRRSNNFANVLIMFTDHHIPGYDFSRSVHRWLLDNVFTKSNTNLIVQGPLTPPAGDWRDYAVKTALKNVRSDYVWFMEQDFFADWQKLFEKAPKALENGADAVGFWEESTQRLHPALLAVKRSELEKTNLDFSPHPQHDHFGYITKDLQTNKARIVTLKELGLKEGKQWCHFQGVTHNYQLVLVGQAPNFKIPEFLIYNSRSRQAPVDQFGPFTELSYKVESAASPAIRPLTLASPPRERHHS